MTIILESMAKANTSYFVPSFHYDIGFNFPGMKHFVLRVL